jgi:hypothetical protein
MSINISARQFSLTVNGIDRAANLVSFNLSQSEVSNSACLISGTMTLQANYNEIVDFTYLASPAIGANWARGVEVVYKVADDSGTLQNFVLSGLRLFILKEPSVPDSQTNQITLQIGDEATLKNYRSADQDLSGVVAGVSTDRNTVIDRYLSGAGISKSISSIPYPFTFPQPKTQGNSFIDIAGKMARSAGHILYTDSDGVFTNTAIDFDATAIASYQINTDEQLFEPVDGTTQETPVDELTVAGIVTEIESVSYPVVNQTISYARYIFFDRASSTYKNYRYIAKRVTVTDYGFDGFESRVVVLTEGSVLLSTSLEELATNEAAFVVPQSEVLTITRYDSKSRISQEIVETDYFVTAARLEVFSAFGLGIGNARLFLDTQRFDGKDETTIYTYTDSDVLLAKRLETQIYSQVIAFGAPQNLLYTKTAKEETWGNGTYTVANFYQQVSLVVVSSSTFGLGGARLPTRYDAKAGDWESANSETVYSTDGSTEPPKTQYRIPFTPIETQVTAIVKAQPFAGDSFYNRSPPIQVDYLVSQAQAQNFGETYLRLLYGRKQSFVFATAYRDELRNLKPLAPLKVQYRGVIYDCLADGISWSHSLTEMIIGMRLIVIGTALAATPLVVSKPVIASPLITATIRQSSAFNCEIITEQYLGGVINQRSFFVCTIVQDLAISARIIQTSTVTATIT